ncbi:MAG: polysaccharide biosynthesis protein, partial [Chthoniobacter sp.]|nr:polysaccharide biosynthesis protein [Chthoniobacter sp.]
MSRLKNFARGVVSGYVQMAANILFTMASVPLALHYLSKEEFGIWALVTQIAGYLALIDLGMAVSVGRILADYKDDRDGGSYGAVLKCGQIVFSLQAALIGAVSFALAPWLAELFAIGPTLRGDFIFLVRAQGFVTAFYFVTKVLSAPFWCHQRHDVTNYSAAAGFAFSFVVLWVGFACGFGIKSMLAGQAVALLVTTAWAGIAGRRLELFPRRGAWGEVDGKILRELLHFGRDIFLMAVGVQLLSASQLIIIARTLGLDAAATWAICSKTFTLAQQAVGRIYENSSAAFVEMAVRGEHERLKNRFRDIVALSASLAVVVGVVGAASNGAFVEIWTRGRVAWPLLNDVLMAATLVVFCVARCHTGNVAVDKQVRTMRFVHLFEGITFFVLAWLAALPFGLPGIAAAGLVATALWSGVFGFARSRTYFRASLRELFGWLAPSARLAGLILPVAAVLWWTTRDWAAWPRLLTTGLGT